MHAYEARRVVALVRDVEWERHIRSVLVRPSIVRSFHNVADLEHGTDLASTNVVLWHLDAGSVATTRLRSTFERVRALIPTSTIILYCQLAPEIARVLLLAGRLGADRVVLRGYDDLNRVVAEALHERRHADAVEQIVKRLDLASDAAADLVAQAIRRAFDGPVSVEQLAGELGVDRRTLYNRLRAAGLPSAAALISWSRLFAAGWLLDDQMQTVGSIGRSLRFTSASELRGMLSRYVHAKPTDLRRHGALNAILDAFRAASGRSRLSAVTRGDGGSSARFG
jgi:AraC-like DNA-binding protein